MVQTACCTVLRTGLRSQHCICALLACMSVYSQNTGTCTWTHTHTQRWRWWHIKDLSFDLSGSLESWVYCTFPYWHPFFFFIFSLPPPPFPFLFLIFVSLSLPLSSFSFSFEIVVSLCGPEWLLLGLQAYSTLLMSVFLLWFSLLGRSYRHLSSISSGRITTSLSIIKPQLKS